MRGVNNKTNGDGEGEQGNQRERLEEGGEIGQKEQGGGDRWQGKIIFINYILLIFFYKKKIRPIRSQDISRYSLVC